MAAGMMDMMGSGMWLFMTGLLALLILAVGLAIAAFVRGTRAAPANAPPVVAAPPAAAVARETSVAAPRELPEATLRALAPDERRLVDLLLSRGGEAPQSDLVTLSGFTKVKVTRILDRLEQRGLVVRLRRGMSNRVVLQR